jgi:signal peptidase I
MEIAPVPHRTSTRAERRRLVLGGVVVLPVVLLVLLPAVLGLDRYVVTDSAMHGSLGRGAVVLARDVPPAQLRAGDVIDFTAPSGPHRGDHVTRRVLSIDDGVATTKGDARAEPDAWQLQLDDASYARVWVGIPWIGLPFVVGGGWGLLLLAAGVALVAALLAGRSRAAAQARKAAVAAPVRPRLPVA